MVAPFTGGFEYRLVQDDEAVKFVYTGLSPTNAFDYLTNTAGYGYGVNGDEWATNADTITVSNAPGTMLDPNWLAQLQGNGGNGVILVEGCAPTTRALWLEFWKKDQTGNDKLVGGVPLYLDISGVEQMYRRKDLRDGADAPSGLVGDTSVRDNDPSLPTQMNEPQNNPDAIPTGNGLCLSLAPTLVDKTRVDGNPKYLRDCIGAATKPNLRAFPGMVTLTLTALITCLITRWQCETPLPLRLRWLRSLMV